jgi:hypothetical protein
MNSSLRNIAYDDKLLSRPVERVFASKNDPAPFEMASSVTLGLEVLPL